MPLLVVHIGAGYYSTKKNDLYKQLIKRAITTDLSEDASPLLNASNVLEESPLTNTGYGASVNMLGEVACDASFIMYNDQQQKLIEYVSAFNIAKTRPIMALTQMQTCMKSLYNDGKLSGLGLTMPQALDYSQFYRTCEVMGLLLGDLIRREGEREGERLILPQQQRLFGLYKHALLHNHEPHEVSDEDELSHRVLDTIGVLFSNNETTQLATSSGGNFLKMPNRLGCASVIGAGIDHRKVDDYTISCMCSGNGEDILMVHLASTVINEVFSWSDKSDIITRIHPLIQSLGQRTVMGDKDPFLYIGMILVIEKDNENYRSLIYYHTTESFYFGYNNNGTKKTVLSRMNNEDKIGHSYVIGEHILRYNPDQ